jgi:hypothetical protein
MLVARVVVEATGEEGAPPVEVTEGVECVAVASGTFVQVTRRLRR